MELYHFATIVATCSTYCCALSYNEIRSGATRAREQEGDARNDNHAQMIAAFEVWTPVHEKCIQFRDSFYLHPRIDWARRKGFWKRVKEFTWVFLIGFVSGVLSSLVAAWLAFRFGLFK